MKTTRILIWGILLSTAAACRAQQFTEPGWFRSGHASTPATVEVDATTGSEAQFYQTQGGSNTTSLTGDGPEIAEASTPEIQALARGLENDPKRIFDFVHDHIRYVHYFGSKKGAQLTLLERSGNDFDQCALLVALLRAAGRTATYVFGTVYMPYEEPDHRDFKHWLGLTKANTNWNETTDFVFYLNDNRGFPFLGTFIDDENDLMFHHIWVKLDQGGSNYFLDPAFKVSEPIPGINLAAVIGLDTNELMTSAAGTSTADYVQNLDEAALQDKLKILNANLLNYIQSNCPNASVEEVIGGQRIVSSANDPLDQELPFTIYDYMGWEPQEWNNIPTNLMSKLGIHWPYAGDVLLPMPQLQGKKLCLRCINTSPTWWDVYQYLYLESDILLSMHIPGLPIPPGYIGPIELQLTEQHPHGYWDFTNNVLIDTDWNDHSVTQSYNGTNAIYAISYAFDPDPAWLLQRQQELEGYRSRGFADDSPEVQSETLNIMGLSWMIQTEWMERLLASQQDMLVQHHHRFGRMAQETGRGYYVDIYEQLSGIFPASGYGPDDQVRSDKLFDLESYFASADEHGLIEQSQSGSLQAASTVKMLKVANAAAQKTFLAKADNWTTGANVRSQLVNYDLGYLDGYINKGFTLLLPQNGQNLLSGAGSWKGYGLVARGVEGSYYSMAMLISGGYNGGYSEFPDVVADTPFISDTTIAQPTYFDPAPTFVPTVTGADPVNMADGSFHISTTLLSLGELEPRGLNFTLYYSSARRLHNLASIAPGWVHSYYGNLIEVSDPLAGLGSTTPAQMAPMVVAAKAAFELYDTVGSPKNWAVTALIAKWGVDQLTKNAVSVTLGEDTMQFIKQPDGTFTSPANCTWSLFDSPVGYYLIQQRGNEIGFDGQGRPLYIWDPYGCMMAFDYDPYFGRLQKVTDSRGRSLTFNGSLVDSVTDSSGRSVSFGHDWAHGAVLVSITDPDGKSSTFRYDTNHQITATLDPLNRLVVSNCFDAFGRVTTQYSEGDTNKMWLVYCSGWQTVSRDPAGGRQRYFYDDKSRLIGTEDALGNLSRTSYDGQDHIVMTVSPLNETNQFTYDRNHNLILSIDPLGFSNQFVYDNQNNLIRSVDARGNLSHFGYNGGYSLTGATNGAGAWATFSYGSQGTLESRTDAGGTTSYSYDTNGVLSKITYPGGLGSEGFLNSPAGNALSHTNARGFVTSFEYNQRRQLTNTIAPTNLTTSVGYDSVGNVSRTTDARGFTTSNTWSATRHLLATTLPATPQGTPVVTNIYDNRDWLMRALNPLQQVTSYSNDVVGRLVGVTDPLLRTVRFGYDARGRRTAMTNAALEVTRQEWSRRGELTKLTDGEGHASIPGYDPAGNLIVLTNRDGKKWQFQFDPANRLTNTVTPLNRQTKQVWNNRGLLQSVTEPSGQTAAVGYDAKGRLINRTDNAGTTLYSYDVNDNLVSATNAGQASRLSWGYDAYDRVNAFTNADGFVIQYRYDANGNLTLLTYPGLITSTPIGTFEAENAFFSGPIFRNSDPGYTGSGYLDFQNPAGDYIEWTVDPGKAGLYDLKFRYAYWQDHCLEIRINGQVVSPALSFPSTGSPDTWAYVMLPLQALQAGPNTIRATAIGSSGPHMDHLLISSSTGRHVSYSYDSLNRLTNVTGWAGRQTTFAYDLANQLSCITRPNGTVREMNYDAAGQVTNIIEKLTNGFPIAFFRLNWDNAARAQWEFAAPLPHSYTPPNRTMTFDDDNRLATFNGQSVVNDLDGNLTNGPLTNDTLATYTYDARNRLLAVGGLSYGYDPAGNRAALTNGATVTKFVINPNAPLPQVLIRVRPGVTNYYVYGLGLLYEVTETATSVSPRFYHYDYRGSTAALTDGNGNVTDRIEYSAYGLTTYRTGTTDTPFLFNGRYGVMTDPNGLLYMRARYYNPYICRFLNPDPAGFGGGLNFYAYANGNPVSYLDPFGLSGWTPDANQAENHWMNVAVNGETRGGILGNLQGAGAATMTSFIGFFGAQNVQNHATISGSAAGSGNTGTAVLYGAASVGDIGLAALAGWTGGGGAAAKGVRLGEVGWYELGSQTINGDVYRALEAAGQTADKVQLGKDLVGEYGFWQTVFKTGDLSPALGDWGATLLQGPTPGSYVGMLGVRQLGESWAVPGLTDMIGQWPSGSSTGSSTGK